MLVDRLQKLLRRRHDQLAIQAVLAEAGMGSGINTADIERLNATFRGRWPP